MWLDREEGLSLQKGAACSAPEASSWLSLCLAEVGRGQPGNCQELPQHRWQGAGTARRCWHLSCLCTLRLLVPSQPHAGDGLGGILQNSVGNNQTGQPPPARCSPPVLPRASLSLNPRFCRVHRCLLTCRLLLPAPGRYHHGCVPEAVVKRGVPADQLNPRDDEHHRS